MGDHIDGGELKRTESYQWPSGHISHLTEGQLQALAKFKKLCEESGYYIPATADKAPTHDDETLLRYLRARKFVPQEALIQFRDTEDWRKNTKLDALYESIDVNEYDKARRLYPQWTGRRDKRGIPFYIFEVGAVNVKEVTANSNSKTPNFHTGGDGNTPWKLLKLFALYENLLRFVLPLSSAIPGRPNGETPISQSSNIVDLTNVGLSRIWSLRNHMSDASKLATAHYPETLDRIFVVGAPSFFPIIWGWVQRWFDPITVSKIFILTKENMRPTLLKYLDEANIPKKYGGTLDWKFGDMPNLEPAIVDSLRWPSDTSKHELPFGPIRWEYDDKGDLKMVAVGTEDGVQRNKIIATLHPDPAVARLALKPGRTDPSETPANVLPTARAATTAANATDLDQTVVVGPAVVMNGDKVPPLANGDEPLNTAANGSGSGAEAFDVPYRNDKHEIASPPYDARDGTSNTRFEQQAATHAEGQLAHGTPAEKVDGQGSCQVTMEPRTVGQAPKEHPLPSPEAEQPSVLEQVKDAAGSVLASVGLANGAPKEDEKAKDVPIDAAEPPNDAATKDMPEANVEEFLRDKTLSHEQS